MKTSMIVNNIVIKNQNLIMNSNIIVITNSDIIKKMIFKIINFNPINFWINKSYTNN